MLISEMHIALDLELDSINVNEEDNLLSEQKDYFLNREIQQYVDNTIRELPQDPQGLDNVMSRLENIETLIEFETTLNSRTVGDTFVADFPFNCRRELATLANVSCKNLTTASSTIRRAVVSFYRDTDLWDDFTISIDRGVGDVIIFNISNLPSYTNGVSDISQDYIICDLILDSINSIDGLECYWEYYNGGYTKNSFIIVDTLNTANVVKFNYKTASQSITSFIDLDINVYTIDNTFSYKDCRVVSPEKARRLLSKSFSNSLSYSPLATISKRQIRVFKGENFIVQGLKFTYIRKPQIVDLSLNRNCDLPLGIHNDIVKLTAKSIKALIDSNNYNKVLTETTLID